MREISSARSDVIWGVIAQGLQYGAMLLLLPVLATRVPSADVGLWFVFMTIQSLVILIDLGFGNALTRNFSYIYAGAAKLLSVGLHGQQAEGQVDYELLTLTIKTARLLYLLIASAIALILSTAGTIYIDSLGGLNMHDQQFAWLLFALAVVFNSYFQWYIPLLIGSGRVRQNYIAVIILRGGFTLTAGVMLLFVQALWIVSLSYFLAVAAMVIYARFQLRDVLSLKAVKTIKLFDLISHFKLVWYNSFRMGLVSVGAFMITKFSVLLVASHFGLDVSGSYAITIQIFAAVSAVALVPFNALLPRIASLRVLGDMKSLKALVASGLIITWTVAVIGFVCVLVFGHWVLASIGSNTNVLPSPLILFIAVMAILELNHGACAMIIASSNNIPFVPAALLSGIAIVCLSLASVRMGFPLVSLIVIQLSVQAAYNNWRWPLLVFKDLNLRKIDFIDATQRLTRGAL